MNHSWNDRNIGHRDSGKDRLFLEHGLRVQPDSAELLALRETMDRPPARGAQVIERSVVVTGEQTDTLFSQVKDFLVNGRHSQMTPDNWGEDDELTRAS